MMSWSLCAGGTHNFGIFFTTTLGLIAAAWSGKERWVWEEALPPNTPKSLVICLCLVSGSRGKDFMRLLPQSSSPWNPSTSLQGLSPLPFPPLCLLVNIDSKILPQLLIIPKLLAFALFGIFLGFVAGIRYLIFNLRERGWLFSRFVLQR